MSVITISKGSYSRGREIAEKLAQKLGYECISREILLETSEHFNIPEIKLVKAMHDAPSILDRFKFGKEKFIAFGQEVFLEHIQKDNVIYHGLAGHFFTRGIPNILKVRIIANIEDRIKEVMKRENTGEEKARYILKKDDEERRKWSMHLYGIDTKDSSLYDVVLHIDNLKVDDGVDILFDIAKRSCFQTTSESQMILKDKLLAAKAYSVIVNKFPRANVKSKAGVVFVSIETDLSLAAEITKQVEDLLKNIEGIKKIRTNVIPYDTLH